MSFYLYLRSVAESMSDGELELDHNKGLKIIKSMSPDEYFLNEDKENHDFILNHFDNFYAYYFAGRNYYARSTLRELQPELFKDSSQIIKMAIANLSDLDAVYDSSNWRELLAADLVRIGHVIPAVKCGSEYRLNSRDEHSRIEQKIEAMRALGAGDQTFDKIQLFCAMDDVIYKKFKLLR
jgi:hypothetical protein